MNQDPNDLPPSGSPFSPEFSDEYEIETNSEARTMAMLCHLLGLVLGFLGPLIIWLIKREEYPFVDDQGKEALNFQLSILIYILISGASVVCFVGVVLAPAVAIFSVVMSIIAALKANEGVYYRYPMTIRLIS